MQNYNLKLKVFFAILTLTFALLTFNLGQAFAQSILPLQVSPTRQEIEIDPGGQAGVQVKFFNLGEIPLNGIVKVADFIVEGKQGTPVIIDNIEQASPKYSGSTWVTLPYSEITIAANDKVTVPATINVPANAHAGGRYVAIYFEPTSAAPEAVTGQQYGTGVSSRIASLVYIRVSGETNENALISRFSTPFFSEYGPITTDLDIVNRGDFHIRPQGVIAMTNILGETVGSEKIAEHNIFPDATRSYQVSLGSKWMIGRYKVSFLGSYGQKGQALIRNSYVWIFPWKVALIVLLGLIILLVVINRLYIRLLTRSSQLEKEVEKEKQEIEKLKEQLKKT